MKTMKSDIAIQLTGVYKNYEIHHEKPTIVEHLVHGKNEQYTALRNINLTIYSGEKVGIIGSNGSGKTTLLKIIAQIATPSKGVVTTQGKVVSLIDIEAGFHPDLTGIQNIYLNGMLLGLPRRDIEDRIQTIMAYADIKQFIDAPLYTYSSGMKLRLGFAVAIQSDPNILLLDESINVGDQAFKNKIRRTAKNIFHKKTLFVVSHDMYTLIDYCDRAIIMDKGSLVFDGTLWDASRHYYRNRVPAEIDWYLKYRKKHTHLPK